MTLILPEADKQTDFHLADLREYVASVSEAFSWLIIYEF